MVVTRGELDAFTRDELQGVVAHEYSHIFHEDMRVNMRLMGMLAGILLISRPGSVHVTPRSPKQPIGVRICRLVWARRNCQRASTWPHRR